MRRVKAERPHLLCYRTSAVCTCLVKSCVIPKTRCRVESCLIPQARLQYQLRLAEYCHPKISQVASAEVGAGAQTPLTCPSARELFEIQLFSKSSRLLRTIPVPDMIQGLYRGGCQCMAACKLIHGERGEGSGGA